jgi:hypothetical protein
MSSAASVAVTAASSSVFTMAERVGSNSKITYRKLRSVTFCHDQPSPRTWRGAPESAKYGSPMESSSTSPPRRRRPTARAERDGRGEAARPPTVW